MPRGLQPICRLAMPQWITIVIILSWLSHADSLPAAPALPSFMIRTWQKEDGLPQNAITAITQTLDGYLWIGTYNGLARFDGARFTVFDPSTTPELPNGRITSLFEDQEGALWIGHENGEVTLYRNNTFQPMPMGAGWTSRTIRGFVQDSTGNLWVVNADALLYRLSDGALLSPPMGSSRGSLFGLASTPEGSILIARNGRASSLQGETILPLTFGAAGGDPYVQGICFGANGDIHAAVDGLLWQSDGHQPMKSQGAAPWNLSPLTTMLKSRSEFLAAATEDKGLYLLFRKGESLRLSSTNGLPSDWVRCLCEDREGNLWVGTTGGLAMLFPRGFETVNPPDMWASRPVLGVHAARDGSLWAGTEGGGLYRLQNGTWSRFGRESGMESLFVWSIAEDLSGALWAGTWGGGLFRQRGQRFEARPELPRDRPAFALLAGLDGAMWIGTPLGLMRSQEGQITWPAQKEGSPPVAVRAMAESPSGTLWFGTMGDGLGQLTNGEVRRYRKRDGLSSDFIECLRLDGEGVLWIGTVGGGLNRWKNGRFSSVGQRQGLSNNTICWLEEDRQGHFWLSSKGGIMRVDKQELNECLDGKISSLNCLTYTRDDGLPTEECSGGLQPAGCQTADGRLWFPTTKGLVMVDPTNVRANPLSPPIIIEQMRVNGSVIQSRGAPAPLRIAPGPHRLEFDFTALSFVAPAKVRFKCRLEGWESDWRDLGTRRRADFGYVPPGNYRFQVIACNNDGVWNKEGASLGFSVLPFFWQTWWFRSLTALLLAGAGGGIVWLDARQRTRSKLEKLERQRALELERARIAKDIHDDLGSSLTRITMLSDPARGEMEEAPDLASTLNEIYDTARDLTRAMDEIVWAVSSKHDTLDGLVAYLEKYAQDFFRSAGIRCRLDFPLRLPRWPLSAEVRHHVFLSVKEALHNVLKHARATEVHLSLRLEEAQFVLTVRDDGCGFYSDPFPNGPLAGSERTPGGNGLWNMHRRLEEIGGRCQIRSLPGHGTTLIFAVVVEPVMASRRT